MTSFFQSEYSKENGFKQSRFHAPLWPEQASGNRVNRLGEDEKKRPVQSYHKHHPFYPFGLAEQWFIHKCMANFRIANWYFKHWITENVTRLGKIASQRQHDTAENWTKKVKEFALQDEDVHVVGICRLQEEWVYADRAIPRGEWVIMLGRRMEYDDQA